MEWISATPRERILHDLLRVAVIRLGGLIVTDAEDYSQSEKFGLFIGGESEATVEALKKTITS